MAVKCIKVELELIPKENEINQSEIKKHIKDISYLTRLGCNRGMTYYYSKAMEDIVTKENGGTVLKDKERYGKSFGSWVENRLNEIMLGVLSSNVAATRQFVENRWRTDKNEVLRGNKALASFKNGLPVMIHNGSYKISHGSKGYEVDLGLFNVPKQKELGVKRFKFRCIKPSENEKAVLSRIMCGTYKQGGGQLEVTKKGKIMLTIPYSFEILLPDPNEVKPDIIMGVDLGVTNVAAISIYNCATEEWSRQRYSEQLIDGRELIHYRQKTEARRLSLLRATKWSSANNCGRGYKTRTELANKESDKYSRFRDTYNHKISRYIVDMAVKYGVTAIQMEDLTGYSTDEKFLKNWSYYDLQLKIKDKAKEKGISVLLVNPRYTSLRCSHCGNIDKANRDIKVNQSKFVCTTCDFSIHADINASRNISLPNIENLIKVDLPA